jgi:hypothetical protein
MVGGVLLRSAEPEPVRAALSQQVWQRKQNAFPGSLIYVVKVHMIPTGCNQYDVLTGRDSIAHSHPGNRYYRELCRTHKKRYKDARRRAVKSDIIHAIVEAVKRGGGRFMTLDDYVDNGKTWVEMEDYDIHKKVSHNLRHRSISSAQQMAMKLNASIEGEKSDGAASSPNGRRMVAPDFSKPPRGGSSDAAGSIALEMESIRPTLQAAETLAVTLRRGPTGPLSHHGKRPLPSLAGSSDSRRHDAAELGDLYLFDGRFQETFLRQMMDSTYQICAVTYHIVHGSSTEIREANLVMHQPVRLRY